MKKIQPLIAFVLENFGPLLVFYAANRFLSLRMAILFSLAYSIGEVAWKLARRESLTALFKISAGMSVGFGIVDLYLQQGLLVKYEAAVTNVMTGIFFALTLRGKKSLIQEVIEKRYNPMGLPMTPKRIFRARMLTRLWAIYFFAKAAFYAYVSNRYTMGEALIIRSSVGTVSFYALMGFSIFLSRRVFDFLHDKRLLVGPG